MKIVSKSILRFRFYRNVRISAEMCRLKIVLKKEFLLYLLKYDHAKLKTFIAPFLEALTYFQCLMI